eukprot:TRINITY_DN6046_c0_g1_i1.p1 TRINITY_DN6046_c0_g1~~TRINITY_DN6046_c0_g1_i1.p1  ORF type:complete len:581 (+),score=135.14 TRINITY_DN6046_c0_g1_i1:247-1989(+)
MSEVQILHSSGGINGVKKDGDWVSMEGETHAPIKQQPTIKTESPSNEHQNNNNSSKKQHIIVDEDDDQDEDDMIVSSTPIPPIQTINTTPIAPLPTIPAKPQAHPPLDLNIVKELVAILPSQPSSNIYRAVYHAWNNMDRALQMLLDGDPLPPIEPSSNTNPPNVNNSNTNNNISTNINKTPTPINTPPIVEKKDKGKGKVIDVDADDEQQKLWEEYQRKKKQEEESLRAIENLLQAEQGRGVRKTREEEERESEEFIRQMLLEEQQIVDNKKREEEMSEAALRELLRAEQEKEREDKESEEAIKKMLQFEQEAEKNRQKVEAESQEAIRLMILAEQEERKKAEQLNEAALKNLLEIERKERQKELDEKTYSCAICYTDCKIEEMYTLEDCYHRFCFDCLRGHFRTQVTEGATRTIRCPNPTCKHIVTYHEVRHVLDPETFSKYEDFLLRAVLGDDPNSRWCPRPNCGNAMIGSPLNPMIVCPSDKCRFAFCFNCREAWHADATCEQYQQWKAENNEADQRFQNWAKANTKDCPKCHSNIEKNGGCNHMTCASCKHQFCWLCKENYVSGHFQNGKCQKYT